MSPYNQITRFAMKQVVERPVANKSIANLVAALEKSGGLVTQRLDKVPDKDGNHRVLTHIIGIERWGQSRLKVALGEPFVQDEYIGYRPADAPWQDLVRLFKATRAETIAIAQQIARSGNTPAPIIHNQFGDMTVKGWLRYLNLHAFFESKKMR